jgi:hypothetical protein
MGRKALKLGVLGALAAAALLAGCNDDKAIGDRGRFWAMTPQEDYYPDSHQENTEPDFPRDDSSIFETKEHEWGTGGGGDAGAADEGEPIHNNPGAWASNFYSELVPGAETGFWHASAPSQVGTGQPLKAEGGIWVQGTHAVEQGARAARLVK